MTSFVQDQEGEMQAWSRKRVGCVFVLRGVGRVGGRVNLRLEMMIIRTLRPAPPGCPPSCPARPSSRPSRARGGRLAVTHAQPHLGPDLPRPIRRCRDDLAPGKRRKCVENAAKPAHSPGGRRSDLRASCASPSAPVGLTGGQRPAPEVTFLPLPGDARPRPCSTSPSVQQPRKKRPHIVTTPPARNRNWRNNTPIPTSAPRLPTPPAPGHFAPLSRPACSLSSPLLSHLTFQAHPPPSPPTASTSSSPGTPANTFAVPATPPRSSAPRHFPVRPRPRPPRVQS